MKPWKMLVALFAAALVVTPATADVLFRGLHYAPQGACVADLDADGRLDVRNIGSSGQDGVSIWSPRSNGARVALDGACASSSDAGSSASLVYHWRLASLPPGSPALSSRATFSVSAVDAACSCDFGALSSSQTVTVSLYRAGAKLLSVSVDRAASAHVAMDAATGQCPNPALSFACLSKSSPKLCEARFSFPSSVHVSVGGVDEDCDDISFRCSQDSDCDGVDNQLLLAAPPGSSFGQVRCSDGSCRALDHWVSGSGAASLDFATFSSASSAASRRLPVHNLGSSGQDGVDVQLSRRAPAGGSGGGGGGGAVDADDDGASVSAVFAHPSLAFDPATDNGSSATITIVGSNFGAGGAATPATPRLAMSLVAGSCSSGACTSSTLQVAFDHSSLGAPAETVVVLSHGVEVARAALPPGSPVQVQVQAPPDGPPAFMIASAGGKKDFKGHVTLLKTQGSAGSSGDVSCPMEVCFRDDRQIVVAGRPAVVGDQIVCWGGATCSNGTCSSFVASSTQLRVSCPNPASALSSVDLFGLPASSSDQVFADVSGTTALSSTQTCVRVPVVFARTDQTPVRAFSVTFHLSPELQRCGASVAEGDYLSRVGGTQMFVTDNGGGSFTVDCGILGPVCGATGSGTLFSVDLGAAQPVGSDAGTISVDAVSVRDCSNQPVAGYPGGSSVLPIQVVSPPPITLLSATTQKSGNAPAAGIAGGVIAAIVVAKTQPATKQYVDAMYRMPFGNYPLYDKGSSPGRVPSPPASSAAALAAGWTPVTCASGTCSSGACGATCSPTSLVDLPPGRDFYYYVAFVRDAFGNESACSNMTAGTLDYFLGDVSDGSSLCSGDDRVSILDISALGSHYGQSVASTAAWTCLDVGPTTDFSVDGRPTVDGRIEFEDFMMFAMNFSVVSAPQAIRRPSPAALNASRLDVPALPGVGQTFDVGVNVDGAGDAQGLSVRLAYDPSVLEQVGVTSGSLLDEQGRPGMALSSEAGNVDVALLGAGPGIAGSGEIARVTFRVRAAGDPQLAIASVTARDGSNHAVAMTGGVGGTGLPAHTALGFAYPNPFRQSLSFQLSLHAAGRAAVGVYDVAGRRVRTLLQGEQPAGTRIVTWDGRDDSGVRLAPGAYLVRLESAGLRETRTVSLVR